METLMKFTIPIACIWFISYIWLIVKNFWVLKSISQSAYKWVEKFNNKYAGLIFTVTLCGLAFLLAPVMIDVTPENYQFIAFIAPALLLFVGAAYQFDDTLLERKVHVYNAIVSGGLFVIWNFIYFTQVACFSIIMPITLYAIFTACVGLFAYMTKTIKSSYIFWVEIITFGSTIISLMHIWLTKCL